MVYFDTISNNFDEYLKDLKKKLEKQISTDNLRVRNIRLYFFTYLLY